MRYLMLFVLGLAAQAALAQTKVVVEMESHVVGGVEMVCEDRGQVYTTVCVQKDVDHWRVAYYLMDGNHVFDLETTLFFFTLEHYEWECYSRDTFVDEEEKKEEYAPELVIAYAKEVNAKPETKGGQQQKPSAPLI